MRRIASIWALLATLTTLILFGQGASARRSDTFKGSGLSGSGKEVMQSEMLPARIARVAAIPGQVWGVGASDAKFSGWHSPRQIVFMKRSPSGSWKITGVPKDASGRPINPSISDMVIASNGEGWAVGGATILPDGTTANGTLLHKPASSDEWTLSPQSGQFSSQLQSLSLKDVGGKTVGYAVGRDPLTILRYNGTSWSADNIPADMLAETPGLIGVATVSEDEAWAVSDQTALSLRIYRRVGGAWTRVAVDDPLFDGPYPAVAANGGYNQRADGSSIAATSNSVLIGGKMLPADAITPISPDQTADRTRPFMIQFEYSGNQVTKKTTSCPDQYRLNSDANSDASALCDQPFPTAPYDIPSIVMLSDSEAFAGGLGLFHYKNGRWLREPNSVGYVISLSMLSASEGFMVPTGDTFSRGTAIRPEASIVGHYTRSPRRPGLARWPQSEKRLLESVAVSSDGKKGVAVGGGAGAIVYSAKIGWDVNRIPDTRNFHAAGWAGGQAWAVGDRGLIYRLQGSNWIESSDSSSVTRRTLMGVSFKSATDGVAVGEGGTILEFNGTSWRNASSPTDKTLYAVTATSGGYIAVGKDGVIVERTPGDWRTLDGARQFIPSETDLYAVATRANGDAVIGGANSVLINRTEGGFAPFDPPVNGTVLAIGAHRSSNRLFLSISPDARKYNRTDVAALRGSVLALDDGGWKDIWLQRRMTISDNSDSSSFDDPVLSIAMTGENSGWAAGGTPSGIRSEGEGHLRIEPSGSIYKLSLDADPAPQFSRADVRMPTGVNFAVFGESWCGPTDRQSICGANVGTGTMADLVPLAIRNEVNTASRQPNGPKFALYTGSMRFSGAPEELAQFKSYLEGFEIPVYAAPGSKDLFKGFDPAVLTGVAGPTPSGQARNDYWKEVFADSPAPWGTDQGAKPDYINALPASGRLTGSLARTHYAFDVRDAGRTVLRVAVVDSSTKSLAGSQNPDEPQASWLNGIALEGKTANPPFPVIVALNQPSVFPDVVQGNNWSAASLQDKLAFEGTLTLQGVTAVFSGGLRLNTTDKIPRGSFVPLYVTGGGGAPLGFEDPSGISQPTKRPGDGFYHGWQLVNINPDPVKRTVFGQFPVSIYPFPIFDSLAMHSFDGDEVAAGDTMRFNGLGRQLSGGWSDWEQAKATYMAVGHNSLPVCQGFGQGGDICQSRTALRPPYRFFSDDPLIADFVIPDRGRGGNVPLLHPSTGEILPDTDGQFGLLCAYRLGTARINLVSGYHRARMTIQVNPGKGTCVSAPVFGSIKTIRGGPNDPLGPETARPLVDNARPLFHHQLPLDQLTVILPPAPGPIAAPAPPASAATSRKEEEEHQTQSEGQEGDNEAVVMSYSVRRRHADDVMLGFTLVATSSILGITLAFMAAALRGRNQQRYASLRID